MSDNYSFLSFKANLKVLVVGDLMLDSFVYGTVDRISPEAPVPVLKKTKTMKMLGGAGNVAVNLSDLQTQVTLLSLVGDDSEGKEVIELLNQYKNITAYICVDKHRPTITKTRFVSGKQHMLRLDHEDTTEISGESENYFLSFIDQVANDFDVIIMSDYNKGLFTKNIKTAICAGLQKPLKIVDSKSSDISLFAGSHLIVPNVKELGAYLGKNIKDKEQIADESEDLILNSHIAKVLTTCGADGMFGVELISNDGNDVTFNYIDQPAFNSNPVDVSGCGDTVVATIALGAGSGYDLQQCMWLSSVAASIVIKKSGTSSLTLEELMKKVHEIQSIKTP